MTAALAGVEAETRLGDERVLRVTYDDLLERPEALVRRCLEFVGEPYDARCLRPLRGIRTGTFAERAAPAAGTDATAAPSALRAAVRALSDDLLGRDTPALPALPVPPAAPTPPAVSAAPAPARAPAVPIPAAPPAKGDAPRIVMVTDHFPKFSETFFVSKFPGLRARGWDVHVVCNRSNDDQWQYFPDLREQLERGERLHVVRDFEAQLAELRPDVVHFGYGTLALGRMHVADAARLQGPSSASAATTSTTSGSRTRAATTRSGHGADMLHFVGRGHLERAQRRGCPPDKPHAVITDAVDVSRFTPPQRR